MCVCACRSICQCMFFDYKNINCYGKQAWKKCRSRDLGSDKTVDFGIKFGENAILVRVSWIKFTFWGINRMG